MYGKDLRGWVIVVLSSDHIGHLHRTAFSRLSIPRGESSSCFHLTAVD